LKAFLTAFAAILYMNPGNTSGKIENLLVVQAPAGFQTELDHLRAQLALREGAADAPIRLGSLMLWIASRVA
jgi:hypothetical protein